MAGRFGGRGRGRGFRGFAQQQEPFVAFPELAFPDAKRVKNEKDIDTGKESAICLPDPKNVRIEKELASCYARLLHFWKSSCYHLEDEAAKSESSMTVERYSDRGKKNTVATRDSIHQFLHYRSDNFPRVLLIEDLKRKRRNPNKVRWDPSSDQKKLDLLEHLEEKGQKREGEGKEEGEDKEEGEEEEEDQGEAAEEDSSDDDYQQNEYFDDDDDDFNLASDDEDLEQTMD